MTRPASPPRAALRACAALGVAALLALGVAALLALGATACQGACERLVQRYCACDPSFAENQRGCTLAKDGARRSAAEEKVRARGKTLEQLCRERMDAFECPDRAVPEFYPGGFSFYE